MTEKHSGSYDVDAAMVTETHFKARHTNNIVGITNYTLLRRDRVARKGGGVAV